jgi:hypothetical protein
MQMCYASNLVKGASIFHLSVADKHSFRIPHVPESIITALIVTIAAQQNYLADAVRLQWKLDQTALASPAFPHHFLFSAHTIRCTKPYFLARSEEYAADSHTRI